MNPIIDICAEAAAQQAPAGGMMGSLLIMIPIFAIMYFLMIRPQQKKQKEHDEMLTRIKAGDRVMTTSGIIATVVKVSDSRVLLAIADKVNVEFMSAAISSIINDEKGQEDKKEDRKEDKKA